MGHKRATLGRFECSLPINRLAERPVAARLQLGIPALVSFGAAVGMTVSAASPLHNGSLLKWRTAVNPRMASCSFCWWLRAFPGRLNARSANAVVTSASA
jgi:hypothetical protein